MTAFPVNHLEISASDPQAAAEFYSKVFGWKIETEESMNYVQFLAEEGGIGGAFTEVDDNNPAGTLVPYVTTDDIEASLAKIGELGGSTVVPKTEIPGIGHFAIFTDPTGNNIGLYSGSGPEA
jgi:predicted enzyme related to lactoylglutathione lyase